MLSFIIPLAVTSSLSLSAANASLVIGNLTHPPIFLMLWASWCEHCRALGPVWTSLSSDPSIPASVTIADIECQSNRDLCRMFDGTSYPRFVWFDPTSNLTVLYLGERDLAHFKHFIVKQLTFPLAPFDSGLLSTAGDSALIIFEFPSGESRLVRRSRAVAERFRASEIRFLFEDSANVSLSAVTAPGRRVWFDGDLSSAAVFDFVIRNSLPFLSRLNASVVAHTEREGAAFFSVVYGGVPEITASDLAIAEAASLHWAVVVGSCVDDAWVCRYAGLTGGDRREFLVFDRSRRLFWVYRRGDVLSWILSVANGSAAGDGPGTGVFGRLREGKYERRASGEPTLELVSPPGRLRCRSAFRS
jgi:thiol-disulfide isomerase/thioredoxin